MEVREEATHIPQHKRRLAFFFAAMCHFRDEQRAAGRRVFYVELDDPANRGNFSDEVRRWIGELLAERIIAVRPGDWHVKEQLVSLDLPVELRPDQHFLRTDEFFAEQHASLVLEQFYR